MCLYPLGCGQAFCASQQQPLDFSFRCHLFSRQFVISSGLIALRLHLEIAHCIPLSPQSVSSHLISSHVVSSQRFSPHLISCLLSLSHLFLADHKVSHTHFLLMLVLSMKIMPYYEIQTQATATTSISWARHHPLCKSMIRPWPGPSCTRPREDLPRPSSEARFVLQNIRFLASAISQKRISCETSLKKSKLKIWKRSFRARCPLKNEIWSCNHCSDNHCSDFHCSDNHCCDNQCCWQSLCDF